MPAALAGHRDFSLSLSLSPSPLFQSPLPVRVPAATGWEAQVSTPRRVLHHHTTPVSSLPAAVTVTGPPSCLHPFIHPRAALVRKLAKIERSQGARDGRRVAALRALTSKSWRALERSTFHACAWTERSLEFVLRPPPIHSAIDSTVAYPRKLVRAMRSFP